MVTRDTILRMHYTPQTSYIFYFTDTGNIYMPIWSSVFCMEAIALQVYGNAK